MTISSKLSIFGKISLDRYTRTHKIKEEKWDNLLKNQKSKNISSQYRIDFYYIHVKVILICASQF